MNDELGSFISHSDEPNIKIIPFLFAPNNTLDENVIAFSLAWPTTDIKMGDLVVRDYLNGLPEMRQRSTRLAAWFKLPEPYYLSQIGHYNDEMFKLKADSVNLL